MEITKEQLYNEYIVQGHDRAYISEKYGISKIRIGTLLQKYGIRRKHVARHGLSKHPLNTVWRGMKERCNNQNASNYLWYGGRGIRVCEEWNDDFVKFYTWAIENGWKPGLELERIDNSKGYSPDNCTWISHKHQCRNRRTNISVSVNGENKLRCEWEETLELRPKTLSQWKMRRGEDKLPDLIKERIEHAAQGD